MDDGASSIAQLILDALPSLLLMVDRQGRLTYINRAMEMELGVKRGGGRFFTAHWLRSYTREINLICGVNTVVLSWKH